MSKPSQWAACLGRVLLSLIFVMSGVHKITAWNETASQMESEGMPIVPLFLLGAIVFELLGGLSVMLGIMARRGAVVLIIFLIPTTLIFHDFWTYEGHEQQMQMINFMKNLAIMGGLFVVAALGPGGCCLLDNKSPQHMSNIGQ
ncbi:MAG: DoxX family protein [Planctomycetaceae bacterium]|nr:DoxX family protein [Planctomycetaceae bacterium]